MSRAAQVRHAMYEAPDPYGHFMRLAPEALHLPELVTAFARAIGAEYGLYHVCCSIGASGQLAALFGDAPALADGLVWTGDGIGYADQLAESCDDLPGLEEIDALPIESHTGEMLLMLIGGGVGMVERQQHARVHALSVIYVERAVVLLEAADDEPGGELLTETERHCLGLTLAGYSHLDIGERFGRSAPAIGIHIRRAAEKLGASSTAEAVAIASRRGLAGIPPESIRHALAV